MPLDMMNDMRSMDAGSVPRAEIARRLGVSRNTMAKYADMEEMMPTAPSGAPRVTVLDKPPRRAGAGAKPPSRRGCSRSSEDISASRRGTATRTREREGFVGERCGALQRTRDEGRLDRGAALIGRARLLAIDELGFLPLDPDGARQLFPMFADAYERQSWSSPRTRSSAGWARCSATTRWRRP